MFGSLEVRAVYAPPIGWLALNFSSPHGVRGSAFRRWPCASVHMNVNVFTEDGYQTPVRSPVGAAFELSFCACENVMTGDATSNAHARRASFGILIWRSPEAGRSREVRGRRETPAFSPASRA